MHYDPDEEMARIIKRLRADEGLRKRVVEMLETDRHGHDRHGHDSRSSIDTVIGSTSPSRGRERPKLNVPGSALEKAGFMPGDRAEIEVLDGEIRIVRIDDHGMKE